MSELNPARTFAATSGLDFGRTSSDYGKHRLGFPPELFDRLAAFGIGLPGQRVLDLGTGTGTVARNLALRGCEVTGLDVSAAMMDQARQLDAAAGVSVSYVVGRAEETGLPGDAFDVVTAGQCWHWFDQRTAPVEVIRLLAPGGRLVCCNYDWIPLPGNVVHATEKLIEKHNPAWTLGGGDGFHGQFAYPLAVAGFHSIETFSFDAPAIYSHEAWRGRIRASAGIAATLSPVQVADFDAELAAMLGSRFPEDPLSVAHRCWALIARAPS